MKHIYESTGTKHCKITNKQQNVWMTDHIRPRSKKDYIVMIQPELLQPVREAQILRTAEV